VIVVVLVSEGIVAYCFMSEIGFSF